MHISCGSIKRPIWHHQYFHETDRNNRCGNQIMSVSLSNIFTGNEDKKWMTTLHLGLMTDSHTFCSSVTLNPIISTGS